VRGKSIGNVLGFIGFVLITWNSEDFYGFEREVVIFLRVKVIFQRLPFLKLLSSD